MLKKTPKHFLKLFIFIITLCFVAMGSAFAIDRIYFNSIYEYNAINGEIDFKGKDISVDKNYLQGEWEFYWNQWIITDSEDDHTFTYQKVPSKWTKYESKDGTKYPANGYASYKVKIKNYATTTKYISFDIENMRCPFRIFVNGNEVLQSGEMSKDTNLLRSDAAISITNYPKIEVDGSDLEIVIEVCTKLTSGLNFIPYLSSYDEVVNNSIQLKHNYFFFVGIIFCACFTMLIIRIFEGKKRFTNYSIAIFFIILLTILISKPTIFELQKVIKINYEKIFFSIFIFYSIIIFAAGIFLFMLLKKKQHKANTFLFVASMTLYAFLFIISILLYFLNIFEYFGGYIWLTSLIPLFIIFIWIFVQIKSNPDIDLVATFTYITAFAIVLSALTLNLFYYDGFLHIDVLFFSSILVVITYLFIIIVNSFRTNEIYRKSMEAAKLREELSDNKASILLSQMQPHFLFNTLNTIVYLCRTDIDAAEDALFSFSKYLRSNMSSIGEKNLVLFQNELDHIKNYVKIEKLRFGNKVKVSYRLSITDFFVPPLCVQPLVENAIRHGVTKKIDGGKIIISTWEDDDNYYISIEDTGVGFNVKATLSENHSVNFSLKNISNRLHILCDGKLDVVSTIGQGTTSTITLPKITQNNNKNFIQNKRTKK